MKKTLNSLKSHRENLTTRIHDTMAGDMGFLTLGETDQDGKPILEPILEDAAFSLKEGEISPVLKNR